MNAWRSGARKVLGWVVGVPLVILWIVVMLFVLEPIVCLGRWAQRVQLKFTPDIF